MKTFMICVAYIEYDSLIFRCAYSESEKDLGKWFRKCYEGSYEAAYDSRNEFDRMVLIGKYTNARRKRLDKPGKWAMVKDSEFDWVNVKRKERWRGTGLNKVKRGPEIGNWVDIMKCGREKDKKMIEPVMIHCLRDVITVMLEDNEYLFGKNFVKKLMKLMKSGSRWVGNNIE